MEPCIIEPLVKHTATVFFMHGRGDSGHGWAEVLKQMVRLPHVKYICPHAEARPCTIAGGAVMPAWFDVRKHSLSNHDEPGIRQMTGRLHSWVDAEIEGGVPSERVLLSGFSQGGALAIFAGLTYPKRLAGIAALSSYIPMQDKTRAEILQVNRDIAVWQTHGDADPLLLLDTIGQPSADVLSKLCPNHSFKVYPGLKHDANPDELADFKSFLEKALPA